MCGLFGGGGDGGAADIARQQLEEQRKREAERKAAIASGTAAIDEAFSAFNDDFFNDQAQAYVDYQSPYLDRQFRDAEKDLIFGLSNAGLLNSSTAADRQKLLEDERRKYTRQVATQGENFANTNRGNLENTRSQLLTQLSATEDPASAASAAAREAGLLNTPPSFDPIGDLVFRALEGFKTGTNQATGGEGILRGSSPTAGIKNPVGQGSARIT